MKATTIISQLQELVDKYGDHEVVTTITTEGDGVVCTDTINIPGYTVLFSSGWVYDNNNSLDVPFDLDIQQFIDRKI